MTRDSHDISIIPHTDSARKPYRTPTRSERASLEKAYDDDKGIAARTARAVAAAVVELEKRQDRKKKSRVRPDDADRRARDHWYSLVAAPVQLLYLLPASSRLIPNTPRKGLVVRCAKAFVRRFEWKASEAWESYPSAWVIGQDVGCCESEAEDLIAIIKDKWKPILRVKSSRPNHYRLKADSPLWTNPDLTQMLAACRANNLREAVRHLQRFTVDHFGREFNWTAYRRAYFLRLNPDYPVLTAVQRSVVEAMAWRADEKSGIVEVSIPEIVRETGFCRSAVKEAIRILKEKEYDVINQPDEARGRGNKSEYLLRFYDLHNWWKR